MLNANKIVGGIDAESPVPWQAYLGGCGATILDAKTLLSAAHCFQEGSTWTNAQIRVGSVSKWSGGQVGLTKRIFMKQGWWNRGRFFQIP